MISLLLFALYVFYFIKKEYISHFVPECSIEGLFNWYAAVSLIGHANELDSLRTGPG